MYNVNADVQDLVNGLQGTKIQKMKFPESYPQQRGYIKLCNKSS